jgi:asparagine synthase (glutamine-hydrolysing)
VTGLYLFDSLRETKIFGYFGMECRVPFFDRTFLDFVMGEISPLFKMWGANREFKQEKQLFREAFAEYLPESLVNRSKSQFSDSVGYSLIDTIRERSKALFSAEEVTAATKKFRYNTPNTEESLWYRTIFDSVFSHPCSIRTVPLVGTTVACSSPAALAWDEAFKHNPDDSGRSVKI